MKLLRMVVVVYLLTTVLLDPINAKIVDKIVAVVNDEIITLFELNSNLKPHLKEIEEAGKGKDREKVFADARLAMLNKMIDETLVKQEAKKLGIVVKEEDVMEAISDMLSRRNIKMEDLMKTLAKEGSSFEIYKKDVKEHLMKLKLVGRNIRSKISVTDEEIGNYYREHREDYEGEEAVRIKQILIILPKDCSKKEKRQLREKAEAIHGQLKQGKSFELLASEHSQGPAAKIGGDLGFVEKGMVLPEVDKEAFGLANGQTSDIIESSIGFHIIKVMDRKGSGIKSLKSVREEIKDSIGKVKIEEKFYGWLEELRKKSYIDIRL